MSQFSVRESKFRHVFGTLWRKQLGISGTNVNLQLAGADAANLLRTNGKWVAAPWVSGGGAIGVINIQHATGQKLPLEAPLIHGHTSPVTAFDFHPFNEDFVVTGSGDARLKGWFLKEGEDPRFCQPTGEPEFVIEGHSKKITSIGFHPCASELMFTSSNDRTVKIWDLNEVDESSSENALVGSAVGFTDVVQSASFSWDGSLLLTSCKDKNLRIFDVRASKEAQCEASVVESRKGFHACFAGKNKDWVITSGFSKQSAREIALWDVKNMSQPLSTKVMDIATSPLLPHFDEDNDIVFFTGKGDASISYFELDEQQQWFFLNKYTGTQGIAGTCRFPKRVVDVRTNEIMRFWTLTVSGQAQNLDTIDFRVPRKGDLFQEDLFPPCYAGESALEGEEWLAGKNVDPVTMSLKPEDMVSVFDVSVEEGGRLRDSEKLAQKLAEEEESDEESDEEVEEVVEEVVETVVEQPKQTEPSNTVQITVTSEPESGNDSSSSSKPSISPKSEKSSRSSRSKRPKKGKTKVLEGMLKKQGEKGLVKTWKKRWFSLNPQEKTMFYFNDQASSQSNGQIELTGATVSEPEKKKKGDNLFIDITTSDRVFHLEALSAEEKSMWMEGIVQAINFVPESQESTTTETSTIKQSLSNNALMEANLSGNLIKVNPSGVGRKSRFFWVESGVLFWRADEKKKTDKPLGNIHGKSMLSVAPDDTFSKKKKDQGKGFQINTQQRVYFLLAKSSEERDNWVDGLQALISSAALAHKKLQLTSEGDSTRAESSSSRRLKTATSSSTSGVSKQLQGYLQKQKPNLKSSWNRRWFSLKGDSLFYFKAANSSAPLDMIPLLEMSSVTPIKQEEGRPRRGHKPDMTSFLITTPTRTYVLRAESPQSRNHWIEALNLARQHVEDMYESEGDDEDDEDDEEEYEEEEEDATQQQQSTVDSEAGSSSSSSTSTSSESVTTTTQDDQASATTETVVKKIKVKKPNLMDELGIDAEPSQDQRTPLVIDLTEVRKGRQPLLFQVKGELPLIYCRQVALSMESLNHDDAFILDCGDQILRWEGCNANKFERAYGMEISASIRFKDRNGLAKVWVLEDGKESQEDDEKVIQAWKLFWSVLAGNPYKTADEDIEDVIVPVDVDESVIAKDGGDDALVVQESISKIKVYAIADTKKRRKKITLIHEGDRPCKDLLEEEMVYVVDFNTEVYIWVGSRSKIAQRKLGWLVGKKLSVNDNHPSFCGVVRVVSGGENIAFKHKFSDYSGMLPISVTAQEIKGNVAAAKEQEPIDVVSMIAGNMVFQEPSKISFEGLTNREISVWIIDGFEKRVYPEEMYGRFFSQDSFIVFVKYQLGENKRDQYVIYFWQGRDSAITEKGTSALLTIELDDETGGEAVEVRVVQGSEDELFLSLFDDAIVVHDGAFDESDVSEMRLSQIVTGPGQAANAVAVDMFDKSMTLEGCGSRNSFMLASDKEAMFWHGANASEANLAAGATLHQWMEAKGVEINAKDNDASFWDKISQRVPPSRCVDNAIQGDVDLRSDAIPRDFVPRLFQGCNASGTFEITEIPNFCQDDLVNADVMILDAFSCVFLWMGTEASDVERTMSIFTSLEYVLRQKEERKAVFGSSSSDEDIDIDNVDIKTVQSSPSWCPIKVVYPGREPASFTSQFQSWSNTRLETEFETMAPQPVEDLLKVLNRAVYSYLELLGDDLPSSVDRSHLENYLSDEEFFKVFKMGKLEFGELKQHQQVELKKNVQLF